MRLAAYIVCVSLAVGADKGRADLVTFEPGNAPGFVPSLGLEISNQFEASHGVRFRFADSTLPRLGDVNQPQGSGTTLEGWKFPNISNPPTFDILAAAQPTIGNWFLGVGSSGFVPMTLIIDYVAPVQAMSGNLIDVDGDDRWTITAFDAADTNLQTLTLDASTGGDGVVSSFRFNFATPAISRIEIQYTGTSLSPSIAFDNFNPTAIPEPEAFRLMLFIAATWTSGIWCRRNLIA